MSKIVTDRAEVMDALRSEIMSDGVGRLGLGFPSEDAAWEYLEKHTPNWDSWYDIMTGLLGTVELAWEHGYNREAVDAFVAAFCRSTSPSVQRRVELAIYPALMGYILWFDDILDQGSGLYDLPSFKPSNPRRYAKALTVVSVALTLELASYQQGPSAWYDYATDQIMATCAKPHPWDQ
jgi:hypothetical protein